MHVKPQLRLGLLLVSVSAAAFAKDLPNFDESSITKIPAAAKAAAVASDASLVSPGSEIRMDERRGLPTFLWAAPPRPGVAAALAGGGLSAEQAARLHLAEFAPAYNLDADDIRAFVVDHIHDTGTGPIIVTFRQEIAGVPVFRDRMRLMMARDKHLIAISGFLPSGSDAGALALPATWAVPQAEALAAALKDLSGESIDASQFKRSGGGAGGYEVFDLSTQGSGTQLTTPARIRQILFDLPGQLVPAWHLELNAQGESGVDSDYYAYVISAVDGHMMFRMNLTVADSFSYRVWAQTAGQRIPSDGPQGDSPTPHPTGLPDHFQAPFIAPSLITLQNGPISTNDPWLPPGATQTTGNNVDAYADLAAPDHFSAGDFRADVTAPGVFDRTYNTALGPQVNQTQQKAAITQLFYDNNFFHDWYYDAGFNEASGNGQASNFGRGGLGADAVRAEAQDSSGRNNANMATPSDGASPTMQMYVFDGNGPEFAEATPPGGQLEVTHAEFGLKVFNVTADLVLVEDGIGPDINDGCQWPFSNNVANSIALINRGNCNFTVKVQNAEASGALGVIIANNQPGLITMGGTAAITIGALMISQADGNTVKASLSSGPVTAHILRLPGTDRDGTIDNQVVAHEWGHFISNRLIGDAGGLNNSQGAGMGEGWGDFHALLMTVRPEDPNNPTNSTFNGVYALAGYVTSGGVNNGYYYGIRRVPYSTDMTRDPLSFRHIGNGATITGAPIAFGSDGAQNAEVHNTGEVWATMLWECYASLLRDTLGVSPRLTFLQAQDRMRRYLVAGYKMTPNSPTLLEARDAVLAAAFATDLTDYERFWAAFAKRGAGLGAVAPDRFSSTNTPVTESFLVGGVLVFAGATLDDSLVTCDADGILDNGDTGVMTVTLRNNGSTTLNASTATISSPSPGVTFPLGGSISFPSSAPFSTTSAGVRVALTGAAALSSISFNIQFNDPGLAVPGPIAATAAFRVQTDEIPNTSATETVEARTLRWTPGNNPALDTSQPWRRLELTSSDHRLLGPDSDSPSDQYLISPVLAVGSGNFSFTFRHRHSFEWQTSPLSYFDGGVIELSNNGGTSWTDIGPMATPTYGNVIAIGGFNPIEGRNAYVATSTGYAMGLTTVTVNLGTTYAGQSVRIRFRIGTDEAVGAAGWEIDDVAFTNITNLPFDTVVADRHQCVVQDSDGDGILDPADCAPANSAVWAIPTEARDITLTNPGTSLAWQGPASPGGTAPLYDVLRSTQASSFMAATCVETAGTDLAASDPATPGTVFYYLVRAGNACGSTLGTDSAGTPRTGKTCP